MMSMTRNDKTSLYNGGAARFLIDAEEQRISGDFFLLKIDILVSLKPFAFAVQRVANK